MGICSGVLDPAHSVRSTVYDNPSADPYLATEIFGDEICSIVTDTALYRETSFTIFMPAENPMLERLGGYLGGEDAKGDPDVDDIVCPWFLVRRHMSVSYSNSKNFRIGFCIYFVLSACSLIMSTMICA